MTHLERELSSRIKTGDYFPAWMQGWTDEQFIRAIDDCASRGDVDATEWFSAGHNYIKYNLKIQKQRPAMTEERLKEIEKTIGDYAHTQFLPTLRGLSVQELIDEVRFLQAALADARKEVDDLKNHRYEKRPVYNAVEKPSRQQVSTEIPHVPPAGDIPLRIKPNVVVNP